MSFVREDRLRFSRELGAIAQMGERLDRTQEVAGSIPASSTYKLTVSETALDPVPASFVALTVTVYLPALVIFPVDEE